MLRSGGAGGAEHGGGRHYVAPQVRVTERDASKVSLSAQQPFFCGKCASFVMKGVLLFCVQDVRPESPGSNFAAIGKQLFVPAW